MGLVRDTIHGGNVPVSIALADVLVCIAQEIGVALTRQKLMDIAASDLYWDGIQPKLTKRSDENEETDERTKHSLRSLRAIP